MGCLPIWRCMQTCNADVLLAGALLGLDQARGTLTHTIRLPVTLGSSVPLCPVFSTRRMRLIQATTCAGLG